MTRSVQNNPRAAQLGAQWVQHIQKHFFVSLLGTLTFAMALTLLWQVHEARAEGPKKPLVHLDETVAELIDRLQQGGLVLFIRHERTDAQIADAEGFLVTNCASQRNLSTAGVANAQENAVVIRELAIPVGPVFASPMCRTQETARLLFGEFDVRDQLAGPFVGTTNPETIRRDIGSLIQDVTTDGSNGVLVSHLGVFRAAFGGHIGEGDAAVVDLRTGLPTVLGIIPANGWNDAIIDATLGQRPAYGND